MAGTEKKPVTNDLQTLTDTLTAGMSPEQKKAYIANLAKAVSTPSSGSGTAGGPSSATTYTKYTESGATSNINQIWRTLVGRDASDKEVSAITAAINAAMAKSPDRVASSGGTDSAINKTIGADPNEIIKQQALQNPETAGYQAATTYYDALLNVLNGPVGGGY